jgi:hypothetical protein
MLFLGIAFVYVAKAAPLTEGAENEKADEVTLEKRCGNHQPPPQGYPSYKMALKKRCGNHQPPPQGNPPYKMALKKRCGHYPPPQGKGN